LQLKPEVKIDGVTNEVWYAVGVCEGIRLAFNLGSVTVTSMADGVHNPGSLHPKGLAADLRTHDLVPADREGVFAALKKALEPQGFDVVWEGGKGATPATTGAHIHVEFQPKPGESFIKREA
jgi:hypothetical protein